MHKMQQVSWLGIFSSCFANCPILACTVCLYGKAIHKPWWVKGHKGTVHLVTWLGQCTSVDQLISSTPGCFAHLWGTPTQVWYQAATLFIDHYSRARIIHLQHMTLPMTQSKQNDTFKAWPDSYGMQILHYQPDNGIFANNEFWHTVVSSQQWLIFSRVDAHFQSRLAECQICDLLDSAQTMLIHATKQWKAAIKVSPLVHILSPKWTHANYKSASTRT